jgi:hypothetical protein
MKKLRPPGSLDPARGGTELLAWVFRPRPVKCEADLTGVKKPGQKNNLCVLCKETGVAEPDGYERGGEKMAFTEIELHNESDRGHISIINCCTRHGNAHEFGQKGRPL